jgi:hypothetical protein
MMAGMNSTVGLDRFTSQLRRLPRLTPSCAAICRWINFRPRRRRKVLADALQLFWRSALQLRPAAATEPHNIPVEGVRREGVLSIVRILSNHSPKGAFVGLWGRKCHAPDVSAGYSVSVKHIQINRLPAPRTSSTGEQPERH